MACDYDQLVRRTNRVLNTSSLVSHCHSCGAATWLNKVWTLATGRLLLLLFISGTTDGAGGVGGLLWMTLHTGSGPAAGTHFAAYDGNGNVVALSAASDGSVTARYEYGPFGEPIRLSGPAAANSPFRFSTKRTCHTTDLVLYEYRAYSPSTGRWPSRDPIGEEGGPNVYGCVNNAGIDQVDPLGLYGSSIDNAVRTCMALPSPAARIKCLEDLIDTLGGGKSKRCCVLAAVVRVAKEKAAGWGKCQRSDSCAVLKAKSDAWLAVAAARARLNKICFGGGDPGHQQQLADVYVVIGRCTKYQVEKGCKGPL